MGMYVSLYFMFRCIKYTLRKRGGGENISAIEKVNLIQNIHLKERSMKKTTGLPAILNHLDPLLFFA